MARRVSLKGKGADIFFGDFDAADSRPEETAPASTPAAPPPVRREYRQVEPAIPVEPATEPLPGPAPTPAPPSVHEDPQPIARPNVRRTTRCAFEFFQDQVDALRRLALEEKLHGEEGNMSQMVREALDAYLAERGQPID